MLQHVRPAATLLLLFTLLTGIAYPLAITGVAQALMPYQANGSMISKGTEVVGSDLIGQSFAGDRYFHSRPSATNMPDPADATKTVDAPYNAANSSGSNLGPLSKALVDRVTGDIDAQRKAGVEGAIPADAVTTSASGLDPHISAEYALAQASGVAKARDLPLDRVRALVASVAEGRLFGLLGEPRVNVLRLNLAFDALKGS